MSTLSTVDESALPAARTNDDFGGKSGGRAFCDQAARVVMWVAFVVALIPLVWILGATLLKGGHMLLDIDWWTKSQSGITARREGGGAVHAIQGTLIQALVTALISVPIGVLTAVYLVEYGRGRLAKAVSFMVDILTGIPSIVAALFIYAMWVTTFGLQRLPIAVCLALTMLMIPTVVRSTEEMLKLVPNELREASYALGVPKWKTILRIVIPTSFSGIITGILLGLARVMGETAPLIILGPYTAVIATNLFDGLMPTLPTMIYQNYTENLQPAIDRTWGAALTLILIIFVLNIAGRLIGRFSKVKN
ncbi:phosphate ABC transporter permease PstA [Knoellia subterranea]|uniref:Phosphate transport system permease protein PstA n=1 Tax=Knoellia subterranea KCTC 19937 TaxID=1385521 RepID=A0A0A0JGP9_9MICO|nr:phosphate ABC transporter permease PstA [Knoellia subterranea]KGN36565.1 phosphate ABC transporter permease [Knoellia subterranea KCTC 19937]